LQAVSRAISLIFLIAGIKIASSMAMIAITTNSSINVNPVRNNRDLLGMLAFGADF